MVPGDGPEDREPGNGGSVNAEQSALTELFVRLRQIAEAEAKRSPSFRRWLKNSNAETATATRPETAGDGT